MDIIPRHREALRSTRELQKQLGDLVERKGRALSLAEEGRFVKAESLLASCLEAAPTRRDIRDALDTCRNRGQEYSEILPKAEEAYDRKQIAEAKRLVHRALQCAPRSREARSLAHDVASVENETSALIQEAARKLAAAEFSEARGALARIEELQVDCGELSEFGRKLNDTEAGYSAAVGRAREALVTRDLDEAIQRLNDAIALCPDDATSRGLLDQVRRDKCHGKEVLENVPALLEAAQFEEVETLLRQSKAIWCTCDRDETVRELADRTRASFEGHMRMAWQAIRKGDLEAALHAAEAARSVCPLSGDAGELIHVVNDARVRAQTLISEAAGLLNRRSFHEARSKLRAAEKLWKKNPEVPRLISEIKSAADRYRGEERAVRKARAVVRKYLISERCKKELAGLPMYNPKLWKRG